MTGKSNEKLKVSKADVKKSATLERRGALKAIIDLTIKVELENFFFPPEVQKKFKSPEFFLPLSFVDLRIKFS